MPLPRNMPWLQPGPQAARLLGWQQRELARGSEGTAMWSCNFPRAGIGANAGSPFAASSQIEILPAGPSKLPELGKELGKSVKSFQSAAKVNMLTRLTSLAASVKSFC